MSEIIIQPDNPMQALTLFDADKKGLDYFIDYVANTIESGMDDPLKVWAIAKKMEYITEGVKAKIKENAITKAALHGERPFAFAGTEMHLTSTRTEYDFAHCGDPEWEEWEFQESAAAAKRKGRETFLKALQAPITLVDDRQGSGEIITVRPPVKRQTMGIKVTIK